MFSGTYFSNPVIGLFLLACALACGYIASRSGRRFLPWFLGGLFFGPLTVLFVLIFVVPKRWRNVRW